jgi:uncharacterized membrane protein YdbT with pleckstrin-like domain
MKLQEGEEILLQIQPEPVILVIWFFTRCMPLGAAGGFVLFWPVAFLAGMFKLDTGFAPFAKGLAGALLAGFFFAALALLYHSYLRRTYIYYITNRRCVFRGGILRRVQHSVPYHKVTDVEMSQNIIERMLGISSLGIYTPGTGSMSQGGLRKPEIACIGLKDNETPAETISGILSKYKATGQ